MPGSVPHSFKDVAIGVYASVSKVRPNAANRFTAVAIDGNAQNTLGGIVCAGQKFTLWAADKAVAPKFDAIGVPRRIWLCAHSVGCHHWQIIRYGVTTLNRYPGI
jgi:hypothetical protein